MYTTTNPDAAIIMLACGGLRGSEADFLAFLDAAWPQLERFAKHRVGRFSAPVYNVEDCVQVFFIRVGRYRKSYAGKTEGEFWGWLGKVCDSARHDVERRERRQPRYSTDLEPSNTPGQEEAPQHDNPVAAAENSETFRALRECLEQLDDTAREIVELRYLNPILSQRATAEILGCSAGQVFKLERQARKFLLQCLRAKDIDYP